MFCVTLAFTPFVSIYNLEGKALKTNVSGLYISWDLDYITHQNYVNDNVTSGVEACGGSTKTWNCDISIKRRQRCDKLYKTDHNGQPYHHPSDEHKMCKQVRGSNQYLFYYSLVFIILTVYMLLQGMHNDQAKFNAFMHFYCLASFIAAVLLSFVLHFFEKHEDNLKFTNYDIEKMDDSRALIIIGMVVLWLYVLNWVFFGIWSYRNDKGWKWMDFSEFDYKNLQNMLMMY